MGRMRVDTESTQQMVKDVDDRTSVYIFRQIMIRIYPADG